MGKKEYLQTIARKVTNNQNLKCRSVKHALHCIAEEAKGESIKCGSINDALSCLSEHVDNLIGGGGEPLKYHLYAWDYAGGAAIAYSEKEVPVAGDVVFLKEDMEGGKITDTDELKLIYHVVSDADGVITVSEHPEGESGGYTFNRNAEDDYEEEVTDVRDLVDITQNGFLMSQKGTMFKGANVAVPTGGDTLYLNTLAGYNGNWFITAITDKPLSNYESSANPSDPINELLADNGHLYGIFISDNSEKAIKKVEYETDKVIATYSDDTTKDYGNEYTAGNLYISTEFSVII